MKEVLNAIIRHIYKHPEIVKDFNPSIQDWTIAIDKYVIEEIFPKVLKTVKGDLKEKARIAKELKEAEEQHQLELKQKEADRLKKEAKKLQENAEFIESELKDKIKKTKK